MATNRGKLKRNKAMIFVLLPAFVFFFIFGWSMYWIGDQKRTDTIQRKQPKKDNVTLMPMVFEEPQEVKNA